MARVQDHVRRRAINLYDAVAVVFAVVFTVAVALLLFQLLITSKSAVAVVVALLFLL